MRREGIRILCDVLGKSIRAVDHALKVKSFFIPLENIVTVSFFYRGENVGIDVEPQALELSIDAFSEKFLYPTVCRFPCVIRARQRQFKCRAMKAKARARCWRMPWLRRLQPFDKLDNRVHPRRH